MLATLGITAEQALDVVLSAVGMYAAFLVMVRLFGARVLARMTTFDLVVTLMLGAVAGRVILGNTPVLAAGVVGLGTLLVLEVVVGRLRTIRRFDAWLTPAPILIIADGQLLDAGLRRAHLSQSEVAAALRERGFRHVDEVAYGIFESTGVISLLRPGRDVDPALLVDVHRPAGDIRPWYRRGGDRAS
ncbi:DUF421 domain-containing protein [Piscicoccus intestinalis]|uniref:DUF421 domain-containing protein n=1 Tax=Piscicoccus intestinalis TaxID=746033 RepID=UPI00083938D0|nr:YetF domain-containing protein [Piscicoccus intestinalis]